VIEAAVVYAAIVIALLGIVGASFVDAINGGAR
jgi:hypothetical protein